MKIRQALLGILFLSPWADELVQATMFVPGRTQNQRDQLCSINTITQKRWDSGHRFHPFAIRKKYGNRECIESLDGGRTKDVDCTSAKKEWKWRTDKRLQSGMKEAHGKPTCYYTLNHMRQCKETYLSSNNAVRNKVEPAICPCGQDMVRSTCHDINECKEDHTCPEYSDCINKQNGYECRCSANRLRVIFTRPGRTLETDISKDVTPTLSGS